MLKGGGEAREPPNPANSKTLKEPVNFMKELVKDWWFGKVGYLNLLIIF
jgi:hypothetical protein